MRVLELTVNRFRNLEDQTVSFSPGVNLFVGDNGEGKTNTLEAIHFFKFGRSFRTRRDAEMICFDAPFARAEVRCEYSAGDAEQFEASIERDGGKRIKMSGKELPRLSELVGRFPCVLFGPDDMGIISGQPAERRRFLDMVGSASDAAYIRAAKEYRRILQHRNAALKARAGSQEMNTWNARIATAGAELIMRRHELTGVLQMEMHKHAGELAMPFALAMHYESNLVDELDRLRGTATEGDAGEELAGVFAARLAARADEERRRMTTLVGPHRDDVAMRLDGKDLRKFGSQGQRRLFALLLRLAELSHTESRLREPCVLLLDDVFSEFDPEIMKKLQDLLDGTRQVFVTSPVELDWARSESARVYHVRAGELA